MVRYNSKGIDNKPKVDLITKDWYVLKIVNVEETKTDEGHPLFKLQNEMVNNQQYGPKPIKYSVALLPGDSKYAWKGIKFLECMGEPIGDEHEYDPKNWEFKRFEALIGPSKFINDKKEVIEFNKIFDVRPHGSPIPEGDIKF